MGPYGKALDFRHISQNQITLPHRRPLKPIPSRVSNAAVRASLPHFLPLAKKLIGSFAYCC